MEERELSEIKKNAHKILRVIENYENGILQKVEIVGVLSTSIEGMRENLMELVSK